MLKIKREEIHFRIYVKDEKTKQAISFPVIDGHGVTKEKLLEVCKMAILNYSEKLSKNKDNKK